MTSRISAFSSSVKCIIYLPFRWLMVGLILFQAAFAGQQRQPEICFYAKSPRYLSPIAIRLALPPAAVVFTLHETS